MPFTFSHPAVVLPLSSSPYFHFPALILGAMSPDFIYFLSGKPTHGGHTLGESEWLNLPLCLLFYVLYLLIAPTIHTYLPHTLASDTPHNKKSKNLFTWLFVFLYSAWVGMVSHITLDHFTHKTGFFVQQYPFLQETVGLPLYKWLQYAGGVIGLFLIIRFQYKQAKRYPYPQCRTAKQKQLFWLTILVFTLIAWSYWSYIFPIHLTDYVTHLIRIIDCFLVTLFLQCILLSLKQRYDTSSVK